ncbi:HAD-IIA family hydrolase [Kroppenstedtia sanguinis]|uniref:HAD-IIA family hydrolase n=1 Tax=Kroppenstedtia sanguinis TaxID=1380684 RepID=A0ABW4C908_9BACL
MEPTKLFDAFDVFLFDLDGVIYVGPKALPGAVKVLKQLRSRGKTIRFLTNNPCMTRRQTVVRLNRLGIEALEDEVISSGWATAKHLQEQQVGSVYVLGDEHLKQECRDVGLDIVEVNDAEAVVVGWSDDLRLRDLQSAVTRIADGASFIATNGDGSCPGPDGPRTAVGTVVEAIRMASGKSPYIVGKPHPYMFQKALQHVEKSRAIMFGDTPDTDIVGAHRIGISAILISSEPYAGYSSVQDYRKPDAVIPHLRKLLDEEIRLERWVPPDFPWPDDIKPGVAGIVMDERGRVLLMRRADNGCWAVPSGHVERGESVEEAIVREIREETGLQVEVKRLIGLYSDPKSQVFTYRNGATAQFVTACFRCERVGGALVTTGDETLDVNYFEVDRLPEPILKMHPDWIEDAFAGESFRIFP